MKKVVLILDFPIRIKKIANGEKILVSGDARDDVDVRIIQDEARSCESPLVAPLHKLLDACKKNPGGALAQKKIWTGPVGCMSKPLSALLVPPSSSRRNNFSRRFKVVNAGFLSRWDQNTTGAVPLENQTESAPGSFLENWRGRRDLNPRSLP